DPVEPALELRQRQCYGRSGSSSGRHYVLGGVAAFTQVLGWRVLKHLGGGIAVHRGHHGFFHAELAVQYGHYSPKAVGSTAGVADNDSRVFQLVLVGAEHYGVDSVGFGRAGYDYALGSGLDVHFGAFFVSKAAGGFYDDVYMILTPRQRRR